MRARGVIPSACARSNDIRRIAAAPSVICELLPACMIPSGLNDGWSAASVAVVVSGRMPWSWLTIRPSPLAPTTTGAISRSKCPFAWASPARRCDRAAYVSACSRVICHCSAINSADSPCGTRLYASSNSGGNGAPGPWTTVLPIGTRLMLSTPPAMVMSQTPAWMRLAAQWIAACESCLPGDVHRLLAGLGHAAEDHVADHRRVDTGATGDLAEHVRSQQCWMDVAKIAGTQVAAAQRGAGGLDRS